MMDCAEFKSIVAGEREDDLSPAESRAFEEHLAKCSSCRAAVTGAEADLDRLAANFAERNQASLRRAAVTNSSQGFGQPPVLPEGAWASVDAAIAAEIWGRAVPAAPKANPVPLALPTLAAPVPAAPVAPTLVPAEPFRPRMVARTNRGRPTGFGLAIVAALAAVVLSFFVLSAPVERARDGSIGRVKPPEDDDVRIVKWEAGDGYQKAPDLTDKFGFIIFDFK
jgi:hypothetical protein